VRLRPISNDLTASPISRLRALAGGVTDRMLQGARFDRVLFGVHDFVDDSVPSERERVRRILKSATRIRPDVAASCQSAALIWNLPIPPRQLATVHVRALGQMRRPQLVAHRGEIGPTSVIDDVRVTSPARTFMDLAAELDDTWLVVVADAMAQRRLITIDGLQEAVRASPDRRGVRRARRVVELVRLGSESPMESILRLVIVSNGLPEPAVNAPAVDRQHGWLARVDLSYPDSRIAIEYQGDHHRTDIRQWRGDITRTRALQAAGWTVILATADDITSPAHFLNAVCDALNQSAGINNSSASDG